MGKAVDRAKLLILYVFRREFAKFREILNDTENKTAETFRLLYEAMVYNGDRDKMDKYTDICVHCVGDLVTKDLEKTCRFFKYQYYIVKEGYYSGINFSGAITDLCDYITKGEKANAVELFHFLRPDRTIQWIEKWVDAVNPKMPFREMWSLCGKELWRK